MHRFVKITTLSCMLAALVGWLSIQPQFGRADGPVVKDAICNTYICSIMANGPGGPNCAGECDFSADAQIINHCGESVTTCKIKEPITSGACQGFCTTAPQIPCSEPARNICE